MNKFFLLLLISAYSLLTIGQKKEERPENWIHKNPETDGVMGIGSDKAFELLKNKKPRKVIVAILDTGVDTKHPEFGGSIWVNNDEVAGNGIDDDGNGYIDDVSGWNFLGGKKGNVKEDTHELTREFVRLSNIYSGKDSTEVEDKEEYKYYMEIDDTFRRWSKEAYENYNLYVNIYSSVVYFDSLLRERYNVEELKQEDLIDLPEDDSVTSIGKGVLNYVNQVYEGNFTIPEIIQNLEEGVTHFRETIEFTYNVNFDPRPIVGDDYSNLWERNYGNNEVSGPDPSHGTGVAGLIAANHDNNGTYGIAPNAVIMPVRVVPNGDERDKDVANGIRYAVDNGAKIINMSFGKSFSPGKIAVDSAIQYAMQNGVILIHAAGNDGKDLAKRESYPTPVLHNGTEVDNWIEVGASAWNEDENLAGSFSNYGKNIVHVFAPGVQVRTTTPDNSYKVQDGTSFASPVVSGLAALIWGYYPELTYKDVVEIIMKSVYVPEAEVKTPGKPDQIIPFGDLSVTGGIINAYKAILLAEEY